jgi:DNA-binding transcriptional MerR regulator
MTEDAMLRIGQLARETGLTAKTLRFYEQAGLIRPARRTAAGYRLYEEGAVERLGLVRNAQDLGFSLDDVRMILDAGDAGKDPCVHTLALVDRQLDRLAVHEKRLRQLRKDLRSLRGKVSDGLGRTSPRGGLCSCLTDGFAAPRHATRRSAPRPPTRKEERHVLPVP